MASKKNLEEGISSFRRVKSPEITEGFGKQRVEEKRKIYESFKREYEDLLKDIATKSNPIRSSSELQRDLIQLYRSLMKKEIPAIFDKREAKAKKTKKPPPDPVRRARSEKWLFSRELFLSKDWISRGSFSPPLLNNDVQGVTKNWLYR